MRAIVLSGGGSKGSYQIGVWMALRKLNIKYDIVCGTSVGALNGALMVQNNFYKALLLWRKVDMKLLFGSDVKDSTTTKDIIELYGKNIIKNKGMDVSKLESIIEKYINKDKFFKSKIDYGLVTINLTKKKVVELKKKDMDPKLLTSYLMASASCYPAFQKKAIGNNLYIDGGYFDNLPINLAISLGADYVIAVDLKAPGIKMKAKKKVKTIVISPNNKLSNFLKFDHEGTVKNIKYGYNDTMKAFNKYYGKKYTFKDKNMDKIIDIFASSFIDIFKTLFPYNTIDKALNIVSFKKDDFMLNEIESLGHLLGLDDTKIYKFNNYNKLLLSSFKNSTNNKYIKEIDTLYQNIKNKNYSNIRKNALLKPKVLMSAIYIYLLEEVL